MSIFCRIGCFLVGHDYWPDRAVDRIPEGANRIHINDDGTTDEEPTDACYVVDQCERCGKERRIWSPVSTVERSDIPKEWDK